MFSFHPGGFTLNPREVRYLCFTALSLFGLNPGEVRYLNSGGGVEVFCISHSFNPGVSRGMYYVVGPFVLD